MILDIAHNQLPKNVGLKAVRLQQLGQNNFYVPPTCLVLDPLSYTTAELNQVMVVLGDPKKYAVRSCYQHEDGKHSYAGVFESRLDVTVDDLPQAIQYVAASVESDRARAYTSEYQLSLESARMVVMIQPMVIASEYGVCFTTAPYDSTKIAIATSLKPGGVTAGDVPVSEYSIGRSVARQSHVNSIEYVCLAVEDFFGLPQNIEFAVGENQVFILQTRPLVSL
jgi:phosphoenolpyruvate synthase/pyruvate phosphate dikinase